jgi:hypothetical protein
VLKNSNKVIIDKSAQSATGVLPYLPLPALGGGTAKTAAPAPGSVPSAAAPDNGGSSSQSQSSVQLPDTATPTTPPASGQD